MIHPNVRRLVISQFNGHYAKHHHMHRPPKISFVMIRITHPVIDGAGDRLIVTTWTTGATVKGALKKWLERRSDVKAEGVEYTVVTQSKAPDRYEPLGARIEVADPFLEATG